MVQDGSHEKVAECIQTDTQKCLGAEALGAAEAGRNTWSLEKEHMTSASLLQGVRGAFTFIYSQSHNQKAGAGMPRPEGHV